ncbi:OsmC family protein, partial [Acinetobacter baumannii]
RGPRPMELILMGLGGCASFDIVTILKKSRQDVTNVVCQLKAERADAIPAVFTKIHLHFVVTGKAVKEKQVAKAVELSAEKYCSASKMLSDGGVEITHDFEIIEAA